jgi:hypothetical protein
VTCNFTSGLVGVWKWRPLLDGRALMRELGVRGPAVGRLVQKQWEWMIIHPEGEAADLLTWLRGE